MQAEIHNKAQVVKFHVSLSFVSADDQDGYQKNDIAECETKEQAIVKVLARYMNEVYPLKGISVHQLVFAA